MGEHASSTKSNATPLTRSTSAVRLTVHSLIQPMRNRGPRLRGWAARSRAAPAVIDVLTEAFDDLLRTDPHGFRTKFRKMAADPFAFFRGSACLFFADVAEVDDRWADDRTSRVWIHGDLHVENFGTYMNDEGLLVFDVNDFDEAYLGHFSWDLRRFWPASR